MEYTTIQSCFTSGQGVSKSNSMTLPEFLKTDMNGKIIINVILPPLSDCCSIKTYKVSKNTLFALCSLLRH